MRIAPLSLGTDCAMERCFCPAGRSYFDTRVPGSSNRWMPSVDRFPVPGKDGGPYALGNVRLAHLFCNEFHGGEIGDRAAKARSGRKAACTTHQIRRERPCVCGQHREEVAS
jgi:hypothetical protein